MPAEALLLDGYIDEPACLGVPPYISPAIRLSAGILAAHGYRVRYRTIDQIRSAPGVLPTRDRLSVLVMIAGVTVPGKYLGGTPATLTEIEQIGRSFSGIPRYIGGPVVFGYSPGGGAKAVTRAIAGFDATLTGSVPEALDSALSGGEPAGTVDYRREDHWAVLGSPVIQQHPYFPHVMCELETARGCPRAIAGGCSFCTEPFYGLPRYRDASGIISEVDALHAAGAVHFRLGRQPDILVYGSQGGEFPRPDPERLDGLFSGIRAVAPGLRTLHIDNVSPGTIAHHPDASEAAIRAIIAHHTPGDTAALGMETADPAVVVANNLKAGPDEVMTAIEVINRAGSARREGTPEILPGLNFVCGLAGETAATYEKNEAFLCEVIRRGLLLRRVNIRQLMPFEGTRAYGANTIKVHDRRFRQFRDYVRTNIDLPLIRKVFPAGTVIRNVLIEESGPLSFGRPMGSYPPLIGLPLYLDWFTLIDAVILDAGPRSLTALPVPVAINSLPAKALAWLPGIGKTGAVKMISRRPFHSVAELRRLIGPTPFDHLYSFRTP